MVEAGEISKIMNDVLVFADSPWHIISATGVLLFGFVIAVSQRRVFRVNEWNAIVYYLWHTGFCLFYFEWTLSNVADAKTYYRDSLDPSPPFSLGTSGIVHLTKLLSVGLGMSYGGVFLTFNLFGYLGMIAFAASLRELLSGASRRVRLLSHLVLLSPGLSFWSSAIGKDGLALMGTGLACWSILDLKRRYVAMAVAAGALLFVRPHMAGILLMCLVPAMVTLWRTSLLKKTALIAITVPAAMLTGQFALRYVGLENVGGLAEVAQFIEARQSYNVEGGSSVDIASMSMPVRVFTYLFRPLFFDVPGVLGLVVSVENVFFLMLFLIFLWRSIVVRSLLPAFPRMFYIAFSGVALFVLANTTANLGIAIRQKWMFMPMLFMLIFSYIGRRARGTLLKDCR